MNSFTILPCCSRPKCRVQSGASIASTDLHDEWANCPIAITPAVPDHATAVAEERAVFGDRRSNWPTPTRRGALQAIGSRNKPTRVRGWPMQSASLGGTWTSNGGMLIIPGGKNEAARRTIPMNGSSFRALALYMKACREKFCRPSIASLERNERNPELLEIGVRYGGGGKLSS